MVHCDMCEDMAVTTIAVNLEDGKDDVILNVCHWHAGD